MSYSVLKTNLGSNFVTLSLTSAFTLQVVSVCVLLYFSLRVFVFDIVLRCLIFMYFLKFELLLFDDCLF